MRRVLVVQPGGELGRRARAVRADHRHDRAATGDSRPLLSFVIAGSFQLVILLVKIFAIVSPESRRLRTSLPPTLRWYVNAVPPATIGR